MDTPRVRFAPSHGLPAHRRRSYRAVQLALGAPHGRHVRAPDRGHRSGALDPGRGGRDLRRDAGSASTGTRGRRWGSRRTLLPDAAASIHKAHGERLVREGKAYAWLLHEGDARRAAWSRRRPRSDSSGTWNRLSPPYDPSRPHVIRFRVPETGSKTFVDLVKAHRDVVRRAAGRGDPARGRRPACNFGAVVDDVTMRINLVARGDDHVNNTARQILMYEALGIRSRSSRTCR